MNTNDNLFNNFKSNIFNGENKKDDDVDKSSEAQSMLSKYMNFIYNGSETTQHYHYDIMKQAQKMLSVFASLFVIVTIFIIIMIGIIIISKRNDAISLIPLIVGISADIFSGSLFIVTKNLIKSRDDFFKESVKSEYFSKIIGLIQMLKNDSDKIPYIDKIVENYCQNNKNNTANK